MTLSFFVELSDAKYQLSKLIQAQRFDEVYLEQKCSRMQNLFL